MKNIIQVLLLSLQNKSTFDYSSSDTLEVGTLVKVPFRNKEIEGIIWANTKSKDNVAPSKIREITHSFKHVSLPQNLIKFIKFVSEYNLIPLGAVLKFFFPFPNLNFLKQENSLKTESNKIQNNLPALNQEQSAAFKQISEAINKKPTKPILLEGITGSGKTEVYLYAIYNILSKDTTQSLVLLPEIMLTNHLAERFKKTLGIDAAIWHSDISQKNKKQTWKNVLNGSCRLVIGARSALFLPFKNLQLIVIDEEHDQSYKQEDNFNYNARDMSVAYGHIVQIPVILSSATPSLETFYNATRKKYLKAELTTRYHNVSLPKISIINMKEEKLQQSKWLSDSLINQTTKTLEQGKQVILFLNRKGYAPITLCRTCGHKLNCPNCATCLVMYKNTNADLNKLACHHCDYSMDYPKSCPACELQNALIHCGPGIDRLFEEAKKLWPNKNIQTITRDTIQKNKNSTAILNEMNLNKIDILIGTQVLSKGYHFPNLNLVGVIDADIGLSGADLKATERTHQLLTQVSGRAGRESKGDVIIQTYNHDTPLLTALKTHNKKMFYNEELLARHMMNMPPFSRLVALIFSGTNEEKLKTIVKNFAAKIPYINEIEVLGPAAAPLAKIRKHYRYRFLIKAATKINIQKYIRHCLDVFKLPRSIRLKIDIDPYNFL